MNLKWIELHWRGRIWSSFAQTIGEDLRLRGRENERANSDSNFKMRLPFKFLLHTSIYTLSCNHQYNPVRWALKPHTQRRRNLRLRKVTLLRVTVCVQYSQGQSSVLGVKRLPTGGPRNRLLETEHKESTVSHHWEARNVVCFGWFWFQNQIKTRPCSYTCSDCLFVSLIIFLFQ